MRELAVYIGKLEPARQSAKFAEFVQTLHSEEDWRQALLEANEAGLNAAEIAICTSEYIMSATEVKFETYTVFLSRGVV